MNVFLAQGYLDDMLQAWEHEFRQASGTERQQLGYRERLFFVANDVVQMSSTAYRQLVTEKFTKPLELAFWLLSKMPGRDINKTIAKLPAVWRSRNIFSARQIDKFEGILSGSAPEPLESMELREVEAVVENEDDETSLDPTRSRDPVVRALAARQRGKQGGGVMDTLGEDAAQDASIKILQLAEQYGLGLGGGGDSAGASVVEGADEEEENGNDYEFIDVDLAKVAALLRDQRQKMETEARSLGSIVAGLKGLHERMTGEMARSAAGDFAMIQRCANLLNRASDSWDEIGLIVEESERIRGGGNPPPAKRPRFGPGGGAGPTGMGRAPEGLR